MIRRNIDKAAMTRSRLPLRSIAVFEAVARLGSLKAAAEELSLSPSAVSHQVRALEAELGVPLFERIGRGVRLSPQAAEYAQILHGALDRMRLATSAIAQRDWSRPSSGIVRILTPPSLATHWLMPRLSAFIEAQPRIDVRVYAVRSVAADLQESDIVICYGDAMRWSGRAQPLLQEAIQPYCAPARLKGARAFTARELLDQPLIQARDGSWSAWFSRNGVAHDPKQVHPLLLDPSYVAIEAAVKGVGVVLESSLLTQEHVDTGRLVAPFAGVTLPAPAYWLPPLREGTTRATVTTYQWLLDQANLTQNAGGPAL